MQLTHVLDLEEMVAAIFTKGLSWDWFIKLQLMSGVTEMPDSSCE